MAGGLSVQVTYQRQLGQKRGCFGAAQVSQQRPELLVHGLGEIITCFLHLIQPFGLPDVFVKNLGQLAQVVAVAFLAIRFVIFLALVDAVFSGHDQRFGQGVVQIEVLVLDEAQKVQLLAHPSFDLPASAPHHFQGILFNYRVVQGQCLQNRPTTVIKRLERAEMPDVLADGFQAHQLLGVSELGQLHRRSRVRGCLAIGRLLHQREERPSLDPIKLGVEYLAQVRVEGLNGSVDHIDKR